MPVPVPPRCDACGGLLRPGVVWFGEDIDPAIAQSAACAVGQCDIFVVIGTAGAVYPAAGLVGIARDAGAIVVEFNLTPGGVTNLADIFIEGAAAKTVPALCLTDACYPAVD